MTSGTVPAGGPVYGDVVVTTALASCWGAIRSCPPLPDPLGGCGELVRGAWRSPGGRRIGRTPYFNAGDCLVLPSLSPDPRALSQNSTLLHVVAQGRTGISPPAPRAARVDGR